MSTFRVPDASETSRPEVVGVTVRAANWRSIVALVAAEPQVPYPSAVSDAVNPPDVAAPQRVVLTTSLKPKFTVPSLIQNEVGGWSQAVELLVHPEHNPGLVKSMVQFPS